MRRANVCGDGAAVLKVMTQVREAPLPGVTTAITTAWAVALS